MLKLYGVVLEVTKSYDEETNDRYNKLAEEKKNYSKNTRRYGCVMYLTEFFFLIVLKSCTNHYIRTIIK